MSERIKIPRKVFDAITVTPNGEALVVYSSESGTYMQTMAITEAVALNEGAESGKTAIHAVYVFAKLKVGWE